MIFKTSLTVYTQRNLRHLLICANELPLRLLNCKGTGLHSKADPDLSKIPTYKHSHEAFKKILHDNTILKDKSSAQFDLGF